MSSPEQTEGPVVAVALKWVDCRPEVDPLTGAVRTDPRTSGASAADRSALEWALRAAEAWAGQVVAVTVGPPGADVVLREAMAAGAGRAVRVEAAGDGPSEDVAAGLAEVVGGASLVVCGDWSLDRGSGSVPAFLAGHLGAAQALGCTGLAVDPATPGDVRAERRLDGGRRERLRVRPPGVVSVEGGSALLRRASLAGVLRSRRTPIEVVTPTSRRCVPAPPPPLRLPDPVSPALKIRGESPSPTPEGGSVSPLPAPEGGAVSPPPAPGDCSQGASSAPEVGPVSSSPPAPDGCPDAASPALEGDSVAASPALALPSGARPAVPRRSAYSPRPRVLPPPPAELDARQRILVLTGALVERTPPRLLVLDPPAAADRILDQLRAWGYLDGPRGPAPGATDPRETDGTSSGTEAREMLGLSGPAPQVTDAASDPAAPAVSGSAVPETDAVSGPAVGGALGVRAPSPWEADAVSGPAAAAAPVVGGPAVPETDTAGGPAAGAVLEACSPAAQETAGPRGPEREVKPTSGTAEPRAPGPSGQAGRETQDAGSRATDETHAPHRPAAPGSGGLNSPAAQEVEDASGSARPAPG